MNPCKDYCYYRYGKEYTPECDKNCDFAKEVNLRKKLEKELQEIKEAMEDDLK